MLPAHTMPDKVEISKFTSVRNINGHILFLHLKKNDVTTALGYKCPAFSSTIRFLISVDFGKFETSVSVFEQVLQQFCSSFKVC